MEKFLMPGDEVEILQAIANVCDADSITRIKNVEVGFLDLVYKALLSPIEQAATA